MPDQFKSQIPPWTPEDEAKTNPSLPLVRELPPSESYPTEALGSVLTPACRAIEEAIQAPAALIGQSLLGAAALAVQAHADVAVDGRVYPTSLFLLTVGISGERKTAVDSVALQAHREIEQERIQNALQKKMLYEIELEVYEATKRTAIQNTRGKSKATIESAIKQLGYPPLAPYSEIILMEEPTYEGIVKALGNGQPSIGIFSDEGGRLIGGHALNSDNQLKTVAGLSGLWDGKPISRTRAEDGSHKIYGKRCSLHLMVQPKVLELLTGNATISDQGILSRCLMVSPESRVGSRPYQRIDLTESVEVKNYLSGMRHIFSCPLPCESGSNVLKPRHISVRPQDLNFWITFHNFVEENMKDGARFSSIRGFASKIPEHALRIAGVLSLTENIHATEIGWAHLDSAIHLAQYYLGEALRLHSLASLNPDLALAQRLLAWCQKFPVVHLVQIYQRGPNSVREKAVAQKLIDILVHHNWLRPIEGGLELEGAFRKHVWAVVQ